MINKLDKVVRLGTLPGEYHVNGIDVFCHITYQAGRLSISGVEGPERNGNCLGSCGQLRIADEKFAAHSPGWTPELVQRFAEIWDRWHLNDMRAGCEHQRASWKPEEELEVISYGLTTQAYQDRQKAMKEAASAAGRDEKAEFTPYAKALLKLDDWFKDRHQPPDADSPLSGAFEVKKREKKRAGWVRPDEHPRGLLTKPCEVCGYKFGTAWLKEEVPQDVLQFLASLPETDKTPAWV